MLIKFLDLIKKMPKKLLDFTIINGYYFIPLLGGIGFILNFVCLLVIFSANFKNREKFNYIIVKFNRNAWLYLLHRISKLLDVFMGF